MNYIRLPNNPYTKNWFSWNKELKTIDDMGDYKIKQNYLSIHKLCVLDTMYRKVVKLWIKYVFHPSLLTIYLLTWNVTRWHQMNFLQLSNILKRQQITTKKWSADVQKNLFDTYGWIKKTFSTPEEDIFDTEPFRIRRYRTDGEAREKEMVESPAAVKQDPKGHPTKGVLRVAQATRTSIPLCSGILPKSALEAS